MDEVAIAQNIMSTSLHQEIHRITDMEEHAREFLFQRGILKATMSCPGCSSPMTLVACYQRERERERETADSDKNYNIATINIDLRQTTKQIVHIDSLSNVNVTIIKKMRKCLFNDRSVEILITSNLSWHT